MRRPDEPAALSEIAADAGLALSDVALIADLDESTVSRLWSEPNWLDRASGSSLQRLMASVPGMAEYVTAYSLGSRLSRLTAELADAGVDVDMTAVEACEDGGTPAPHVGNALQAALYVVRGDSSKAVSYLARFWGLGQDQVLGRLFSADQDRLLANPARLIEASAELAPRLRRPAYSFHSILAEAALVHHVGPVASAAVNTARVEGRQEAMSLRSSVMGVLINTDDFDSALRYEKATAKSPVLRVVEEWSFPTYTRDARPDPAFSLPRSLLLQNTAQEVIREIGSYPDAYVHYLLTVYVPLALSRDRTFGLALPALKAAIADRLSRDGDPRLRALCESTLRQIEGAPVD
jgi:hypothetical protein